MLRDMRRLLAPLALLLVLAGAFAWWWNRPERVVARRIAGLFEAAAVEPDAGNITRSTRGNAIEGFLAPNVAIGGPEGVEEYVDGPQSRSSLTSNYTLAAKNCRQISFQDLEVEEVSISGETAQAKAQVDAIVELTNSERPADGILHLDMDWAKIEGKWVLSSVVWKETSR
jgi:hypothetical protein